jgi:hypothetical protein
LVPSDVGVWELSDVSGTAGDDAASLMDCGGAGADDGSVDSPATSVAHAPSMSASMDRTGTSIADRIIAAA